MIGHTIKCPMTFNFKFFNKQRWLRLFWQYWDSFGLND